jgi:hypothetical protein
MSESPPLLVCGLINGTIALVDTGRKAVVKVLEKAHTGTVVACTSLGKGLSKDQ